MALTRTQVGRDGLRVQLEKQFNEQFVGEMRIGRLRGNLLNTLYAENIHFLDSTGAHVAGVDAAVLEPAWFELLSGAVSLHRITLVRPELNALMADDGSWNLGGVFGRHTARATSQAWAFSSSDIRIMDGAVYTRASGRPPEAVVRGSVFNYADAEIVNIQAQFSVTWQRNLKLVDVGRLSLEMVNENVTLTDLHGEFAWETDRIELNEAYVEMDGTRLRMAGYVDDIRLWETEPGALVVDLDVQDSRIDHNAIRRLLPAYPLADTMRIESRIQGTLGALRIDRLRVERDQLALDVSGVVSGLPDSLSYAVSGSNSVVSWDDVAALYPAVSAVRFPAGPLFVRTLDMRGAAPVRPFSLREAFNAEALFGLESEWGAIAGNVEIDRPWRDSLVVFNGYASIDSLDLAGVAPERAPVSRLYGALTVQGEGAGMADLIADVKLGLSDSAVQGHPIDTLDAYVYAHHRVLAFDAMAFHPAYGTIRSDGMAQFDREVPRLEADFELDGVDLGRLTGNDSLETRLNGLIGVDLSGRDAASVRGQMNVAIDSSTVRKGGHFSEVPPHRMTVSMADAAGGRQTIRVEGDPLHLTLEMDWDPERLTALTRRWSATLKASVRDIVSKRVSPEPAWLSAPYTSMATDPAGADPQMDALLEEALRQEETSGIEPLAVDARFEVRNFGLLHAWMPALPDIATNATGRFAMQAAPYDLAVEGELTADSLRIGGVRLGGVQSRFDTRIDRRRTPETMFNVDARLIADSLQAAGQSIASPTLELRLAERNGDLSVFTKSNPRVGAQRIVTRLEMLPDRNRVYLDELSLSVGNSLWTAENETYVDVFGRTIVIPGVVLQSRSAEADILQSVQLSGTLSPLPGDTASFVIDNIALRPVSQFLGMNLPMGGLLSGQLALTTPGNQPELTGAIHIDRFSLDTRILGNVDIASRYIPGEPDVGLRVEISPVPAFNRDALLPDAALQASYEENALLLDGTFRLPRFNDQATGFIDAGAIDLELTMTRADVFFFELIFPNFLERASGYLTGGGTIGGDFSFPLFDANLALVDGLVSIPKFNLVYSDFQGPVRVNRDGIFLQDATFRDATGGNAALSGGFLFNEYRFFSFDLQGQLNELLIMNQDHSDELPFYGQIWASGTLTLTGPTHNAMLRSQDAVTKASSELFIPITEDEIASDVGFLIFADSTGEVPDFNQLAYRRNLLSKRPEGERMFIDGLSMDLNIFAPPGSTIHLVFDPLLGDVVNAVSSGRIQIQKKEGEFATYGALSVESGDYLFTAGDVFARKFLIDRGGSITWDGDPINAALSIPASYRTRASTAGLPGRLFDENSQIPLVVGLDISGRVSSPEVELSLRADRSDRNYRGNYEGIEAILNQSERIPEYATSVLLTNSFVLTTEATPNAGALQNSGNQLAFSSVSQLVASQLNRFLREALPNVDLNLGLQGESLEDPDVTYGVALYLLDERVVVRGEGIYQNDLQQNQPGLEGEFEVEVRLSPNVSLSVFLRREGDVLAENALTSTRGAGLYYQTQFSSWRRFVHRLFGWMSKKKDPPAPEQVAEHPNE